MPPQETQGPLRLRSGRALDFARDDKILYGGFLDHLAAAKILSSPWQQPSGAIYMIRRQIYCSETCPNYPLGLGILKV